MAKAPEVSSPEFNRIISGTTIDGNINASGDIRVDGAIYGTVNVKGKFVLGSTGKVKGDIDCQNADISGIVDGKVTVKELLHLKSTAKLNGDIITNKLAIDPGAIFAGACKMGDIKTQNNAEQSENTETNFQKSAK